jgi:hypothetical protein
MLPFDIFDKCVKDIGMKRFKNLHGSGEISANNPVKMHYIVLFFLYEFYMISHENVFNEAIAHKMMSIS